MQIFNSFQAVFNANGETGVSSAIDVFNARYKETRDLSPDEKEVVANLQQKVDAAEAVYYQKSDNRSVEIANLSNRLHELKLEERADFGKFWKDTKPDIDQLERYGVRTTFVPPQKD